MTENQPHDTQHDAWSAGRSYDEYMGRWSSGAAASFLEWLALPSQLDWVANTRARFEVGAGDGLPCADQSVDAVISALAYNFMPDRAAALAEFRRVARPDAAIAF